MLFFVNNNDPAHLSDTDTFRLIQLSIQNKLDLRKTINYTHKVNVFCNLTENIT